MALPCRQAGPLRDASTNAEGSSFECSRDPLWSGALYLSVSHLLLARRMLAPCREFFVKCSRKGPDEHLWRHCYSLDPRALPKFIDEKVAADILTIGKSINFLRKLCGDTEWIMGAMSKVIRRCVASILRSGSKWKQLAQGSLQHSASVR